MTDEKPVCLHCGQEMKKWQTPTWSTWGGDIMYVCFNDECPYYVRGWDWMLKTQNMRCSYQQLYNPRTRTSSPIPVRSSSACRDGS
ncbi:MAG: ogr/Delta-like zinc finger family protein [Deltaproteobacteria bacterium]|nr:ogr/Delta-like zinc finger family protein [Deltaproteobacteria bacterium]